MPAPDCPAPAECPVPAPPDGRLTADFTIVDLPSGAVVCRAYELKWGYDSFNPGFGDTRFAPIAAAAGPVPTLYGGVDDLSVLLETVFHDVHHQIGDRVVYEAVVRRWGVAFVRLPRAIAVVDLRDDALVDLGFDRSALITTTAEHYPCTRAWAAWLHAETEGPRAEGLLWHSRQAELYERAGRREVFVLWGDRAPAGAGVYPLAGPGVRNLTEGAGRVLLEAIAEDLGARVEPADD